MGEALGWGHVFRALREAGEEIRLRLVDGSVRDGAVLVAGRDFVRLRAGSGRDQVVPFDAIAVVSGRRDVVVGGRVLIGVVRHLPARAYWRAM